MPPLADRFALLEDTLRFVREGWSGEHGTQAAFRGRTVQASRLLNSPQALSRPHPPILVGGGGELKTLRLVARYADACNVFGSPEQVAHKYDVLRGHCETEGRDYDTIEKTNLTSVSITPDGAQGSLTPVAAGRPAGRLGRGRIPAHHLQRPQRLGPVEAGAHRT